NVGSASSLADVVQRWRQPMRPPLLTTLDLVRAAAQGGYAVGAFNVYNLEGVRAVVKGAEEERSPAIIQVAEGGYAVGAFNVYSLEGVRAVVRGAEEERSPAIIQVCNIAVGGGECGGAG
ncbi:unnamed protein product, partial [Closterium sp. Yama58-4]